MKKAWILKYTVHDEICYDNWIYGAGNLWSSHSVIPH